METLPGRIAIKIGEMYTLRLPGRSSAGYTWEYSFTGSDQVVQVTSEGVREKPRGGVNERTPESYSADILFHLRALEPGQVTINFSLRRPWEKRQPPLQIYALEISVLPIPR